MVQEKGVVMIIDWSGFTFRQVIARIKQFLHISFIVIKKLKLFQYAKLQISSVRLVVDSLEYG